jgi:hypothetical protein
MDYTLFSSLNTASAFFHFDHSVYLIKNEFAVEKSD